MCHPSSQAEYVGIVGICSPLSSGNFWPGYERLIVKKLDLEPDSVSVFHLNPLRFSQYMFHVKVQMQLIVILAVADIQIGQQFIDSMQL